MKKLTLIALGILTLFIFIPFIILTRTSEKPQKNEATPDKSVVLTTYPEEGYEAQTLTSDDITYIATYASDHLEESDSTELKRAVLTICKNNYLYNKKEKEKLKISNYSDKLLDELSGMFVSLDITIRYKDRSVYIPIIKSGSAATTTSDDYPYMVSVATPWEALEQSFNRFYDYPCGISVSSMRHLANDGLSAEEILSWHLPLCSIKNQ